MPTKRFQFGLCLASALSALALSMQGCLFSSGGKRGDSNYETRGHYSFGNPTGSSLFHLDSTYTVRWTASDSAEPGYARLSLYKGDAFLGDLEWDLPAEGSLNWSLKSSRFLGNYGLGSGDDYRLRLTSMDDTSVWDFSPPFTVYSDYSGTLETTSPASGTTVKLDSVMRITWTKSGNVGTYVGLQLFRDTTLAYTITATALASSGTFAWSRIQSAQGSGDNYRIRIFAVSDPSIGGKGPAFAIASNWSGSYAFRKPGDGDTIAAGTPTVVRWTVTGNPGSSAQVYLCKSDSTPLSFVGTAYTASSDSLIWSVPGGQEAGDYRLRIASASDPGLFAVSSLFHIKGVEPDEYEDDDTQGQAGKIGVDGESRTHTLPSGDTDWMRFDTKKDKRYLVAVASLPASYLALDVLDSAGRSVSYRSGSDLRLIFPPGYGGVHYLRVRASSTTSVSYQVSILEFDSSAAPFRVDFSSPDSSTTWAAGSSYSIVWSPDSVVFGRYVSLALFNDTALVQSISSSLANSGRYQWTLPSSLYSGDKYRLRISSTDNPDIYAFGPYFSISGTKPDEYEPDDSRTAAKSISADGAAQDRILASGDADWVRFQAEAGKTYLASANSTTIGMYLYITDSLGNTLMSRSGSQISLNYAVTRSGTYYLRVQYYSGAGSYKLSLSTFDAVKGLPVVFTAPDSGTVWSAGSSYTVRWTPDSAHFGSTIYLDLYNDTLVAAGAIGSLSNSGTYAWTIQAGSYTSDRYRIRISSYANRAVFGYSDYFTISGITPDSYEPDNLKSQAKSIAADGSVQQRNIVYADSDWVSFDAVAGKTYLASVSSPSASVYMYLYDSLGTALSSRSGTRFSTSYTPTRSGRYFLRIQYYSGAGSYNLSLAVFDSTQGGAPVRFTVPDSNTVWSAGSTYPVTWVPDSTLFGYSVGLALYRENTLIYAFSSSSSNSGTASVSLPAGLASGNDYRLRMTNYSSNQVFGYSPYFTISGLVPDSLEPNDSVPSAAAVSADGSRKSLSLSYRDRDWFRFTAEAQKLYLIRAVSASTLPTYLRLWPANGSSYLLTNTKLSSDSVNSLAWVAPSAGEYLISVEATSISYTGNYGFDLSEIDPAQYKFAVSSPAADTSFTQGQSVGIRWSDPIGVKGTVDLFLYDGDGVVQTIAAGISNTGAYSWIVPAGLPARDDYSVRVISRTSSAISGTSGTFSLSP